MCTILIQVLLSAIAGLVWCVLITCFCMFLQLTFSKKAYCPELTGNETILLKELLAGRISLPSVTISDNLKQETKKIESIIAGFATVIENQRTCLENILEKLTIQTESAICFSLEDDISPLTIDEENNDNPMREKALLPEDEPQNFFRADFPLLKEEHLQQFALAQPLREIRLPGIGRNILEKSGCRSVHDALLIMLKHGSRNALSEIPLFGFESIHALELFMVQERLIKVDIKTGVYISDFWDQEKYNELQQRCCNV